jgi:hypothetical protein
MAKLAEFDEYTVVLKGEIASGDAYRGSQGLAGQAIVIHARQWVRYSPPGANREETIRGFAKAMS